MNKKMSAHCPKTVRKLPMLMVAFLLAPGMLSAITLANGTSRAPDFSLPRIDGETVSLGELGGKNALLLFGTTRCPHCDRALPILESFAETLADDLTVLFVAVGQNKREVAESFGPGPFPYGILVDETSAAARSYGITRVPTCVFVDEKGFIQYAGPPREQLIWRLLSGERLRYPQKNGDAVSASKRLAKQAASQSETKPRRFIVELDEDPRAARKLTRTMQDSRRRQYADSARGIGAKVVHNYGRLKNRIVLEIDPQKAEKLRRLPRFKSFKEDRRVKTLLEDSVYQIKADYAWDSAVTGEGVKVCVVDTGIDYSHPDLKNKVIAQYNPIDNSNDAMDDNGHGTHCAGIIASNGLQYRGVSYDVSLLGVKALDFSGNGYSSDVMLGIDWCVAQGADVINLSLGEGLFSGTCDDDEMAKSVNAAVDAGVVVVCAAGNDGDLDRMVSPACASKAIAVGSLDKNDNIASYSDGGSELDVVAPGGGDYGGTSFPEIVSTFSTEVANNPFYCLYRITDEWCYDDSFAVDGMRYIRAVGTSMAAPHVAGAAALLIGENSSLTPDQVKQVLQENADDLGAPGWDNVFGWGRINLEKALDNLPAEIAELTVSISEPNLSDMLWVERQFPLDASVDCFGGDGCGEVEVHAQYCAGRDCNDFVDIDAVTVLSTLDNNPNDLGVLSGYTVETDMPVVFDAETVIDLSETTYQKSVNPDLALVGSTVPGEYSTGDLEPEDGLGAIGENAEKLYEFELPAGKVKSLKVRMENYMVIHFDHPPFATWQVYTSTVDGTSLNLIGECTPPEGGGGEAPVPDCWFISADPAVLGDLTPGGVNYIKLVSYGVEDNDWLTFNDIEVIAEYEIDPDNDDLYKYYVKFDLSDVSRTDDITAARMQINVVDGAEGATADVYLVDDTLSPIDSAKTLHEPGDAAYTELINPVKNFSCETAGLKSLNIKAVVEEALAAGHTSVAFQISERNNDQLFSLDASGGQNGPALTISRQVEKHADDPSGGETPGDRPENGPMPLTYDTAVVRALSTDEYAKYDEPNVAVIGANFTSEYRSGDLEPEEGIGAIGEDAHKVYGFDMPAGTVKGFSIRMVNYLVIHFDYPPYATWQIYTSDANGTNLHFIGECTPAEGGGGETPSPDCWFTSDDPAVLAYLSEGGKRYIRVVSTGVGENDWLTFSDIEVIVEYEVDPANDQVSRYYVKFDISDFGGDVAIDSATLNLHVRTACENGTGLVNLADPTGGSETGAYTIFNVHDPDYSSLTNPIKTFECNTTGPRPLNVKAALEDAIESGETEIAFLIAEQNEKDKNARFAIDASAGGVPPHLDVYVKSSISGGLVHWDVLAAEHGDYRVRVLANNNIGLTSYSDERVVTVHDPNMPVIGTVDCLIDSQWQDCADTEYGDYLEKVRVIASDPQEVPDVRLVVRNVPDDHNFVDITAAYSDGVFVGETDMVISDSGQWRIDVKCSDSDDNVTTRTITWNVPWGRLASHLISPTTAIDVPKSTGFTIKAQLECLEAECPPSKLSLQLNDPNELKYDDGTAEDYGDIGSINSFLAVKFEPGSYPAHVRTARFFVWDQTAYPFEINLWDDNGSGGTPGTELITPFVVDPVVASGPEDVKWFDVDLTEHNIIIESGQFYIGWRQLEQGKINQVGFDATGIEYRRTWGYLPELGWFNLDDYCQWCSLLPDFCDFCGNIMIRAVIGDVGSYEGGLPSTAVAAPLYVPDQHPGECAGMKASEACEAEFEVYAIGPASTKARLQAVGQNNYGVDVSSSVTVNITPAQTPCDAANLDAVGQVDLVDMAILSAELHRSTPSLAADVNSDGQVDFKDLAALAEHWLQSCR